MHAERFLDRDLPGWPILADRHRAKRHEVGRSERPAGQILWRLGVPGKLRRASIRAAIQGLRGPSKSGVARRDVDGNPCLTYKVEVRGRELEVFNQAWPIHVRPEDLDWVVGELFEAAQAK